MIASPTMNRGATAPALFPKSCQPATGQARGPRPISAHPLAPTPPVEHNRSRSVLFLDEMRCWRAWVGARGWAWVVRGPRACPACLQYTVGHPTIPIPAGLLAPFQPSLPCVLCRGGSCSNPCRAPPPFQRVAGGCYAKIFQCSNPCRAPPPFQPRTRLWHGFINKCRSNPCRAPCTLSDVKKKKRISCTCLEVPIPAGLLAPFLTP